MKKTIHNTMLFAAAILIVSILPSCLRDVIFDEKSDYRINIRPLYDMLYDRPEKGPAMFRVLLYDPESHKLLSSNMVSGEEGYLYNIRPGVYDILVYNYTLNRTKVTHEENLSLIRAGTSALSYRDTPIVETPDHLFVQRFDKMHIPYLSAQDDPFILNCEPRSVVDSWILIIDGIKGLKYADYIDVYISGQAQNAFIAKTGASRISNVNTTIFFAARCDYAKGLIYTPFTTFGKIPDERAKLELNIRIVGSGGEVYSCTADVTDQFDNPENVRHEIRATFDVTISERKDGGMSPAVDPWNPDTDTLILR